MDISMPSLMNILCVLPSLRDQKLNSNELFIKNKTFIYE